MIDVWSSSGVRLPRLLPPKNDVPLPMEEESFLQLKRDHPIDTPVKPNRRSSLLAEMVRLNRILQQINDFNVRASEHQFDVVSITSDVENLSKQLDTWLKELPDHMRDTQKNMIDYAKEGLGRMFVAIYLGYYHYGQMLFYRFLHEESRTFDTSARFYARKCKQHASSLLNILYASEEIPECDVKYNMVGHVVVIASTIQIHSLLFESDEEILALAKWRLEMNFCILTGLRQLWPTLDVCMERLMAFHQACRDCADTSFCMDKWMVRFLVEFANPISDKASTENVENPWSLSTLGIDKK